LLLVMGLIGSLALGYAVMATSGWLSGAPRIAEAAALPGFGSLSGTVASTTPFKAAQVFIRNVDKRMLYTVYTNAGQFRATALFPGNYEVSASVKALQSDVQKLVVKAGDNPKLTLSLRDPADNAQRTVVSASENENSADTSVRAEASYEEIYPPARAAT